VRDRLGADQEALRLEVPDGEAAKKARVAEYLWERLGYSDSIAYQAWPMFVEKFCIDSTRTIVVQVNGKIRDKFEAALDAPKQELEKQALEEGKSDVGWGSQIRSYVLDSSRIKDLRTSYETGNTKAVLDGDLDDFIEASLKQGM